MSKILWHGDGGCSTGFARVTDNICKRLVAEGHEVDVLAINYTGELPEYMSYPPYKLLVPTKRNSADYYGVSRFTELFLKSRYDAIIILNDIPIVNQIVEAIHKSTKDVPPIIAYVPVDMVELPPSWMDGLRKIQKVIVYTQFGKQQLIKAGLAEEMIEVACHGTDSVTFAPPSFEHPVRVPGFDGQLIDVYDRQTVRRAVGLDDKFILLWADRNSERKYLGGFLQAVSPLAQKYGDDLAVWLHCAPKDVGGDIRDLCSRYRVGAYVTKGLDTYNGISEEYLNAIYAMADLKVSSALGEGWGLTNCEALSSGTATVAQDFGPNSEILGPEVACIPTAYMYPTPKGPSMGLPDIHAMTAEIEAMITSPTRRKRNIESGLQAISRWSWESSHEVFEKVIEEVTS